MSTADAVLRPTVDTCDVERWITYIYFAACSAFCNACSSHLTNCLLPSVARSFCTQSSFSPYVVDGVDADALLVGVNGIWGARAFVVPSFGVQL